jgi:hypothetical protein
MNLERTILETLRRSHPFLMAMPTVWSEVLLDQPRASYSGFKAALQSLEEKGQAIVLAGEDRTKIKITDAGLARLME